MKLGKSRVTVCGGLALSLLLVAACERPVARDPLADQPPQQAQPQEEVEEPQPEPVVSDPNAPQIDVGPGVEVAPETEAPAEESPPEETETETPVETPEEPAEEPTAELPSEDTTEPEQSPSPGGTYTVKPGDRLFSIGREFGVSPYSIAAANQIFPPYIIRPGDVLTIPSDDSPPPPDGRTYVVRSGDNLFRIALNHNTTVQAIVAANPGKITNIRLIFPGQVLQIP